MKGNHFISEAEWRRWFARQQLAKRKTSGMPEEIPGASPVERKWISGAETTKDTGKLHYGAPHRIRVRR